MPSLLPLFCLLVVTCAHAEDTRLLRLRCADLVEERFAGELVLVWRGTALEHGYAVVPERDNLVHTVAIRPSPPLRFVDGDGQNVVIPAKLRGDYAYNDAGFKALRAQWQAGTLRIEHTAEVQPLRWDDDRLHGTIDVLVHGVDEPNTPGRDPHSLVYRLAIEASWRDGRLHGAATAWSYAHKDQTYGADAPRRTLTVEGAWEDRPAADDPARAFATGAAWPHVGGPLGNGAAWDAAEPLVTNLHDARLAWVADEPLSGGRDGGLTRGDFALFPIAWSGMGYNGYAGPAIAEDRVFLHHFAPDVDRLAAAAEIAANAYVQLGADPRVHANRLGALHDAVLCVDARNGRTLWHWRSEQTFGDVPDSKAGRGATVAVHEGRVFARGHLGMVALAVADGTLLWQRAGENGIGYSSSSGPGMRTSVSSHDKSPVVIGGVLVLVQDRALIGLDPADGRQRWVVPEAAGSLAVPVPALLDGRPVIIGCGTRVERKGAEPTPEDLVAIDPATGNVLWRSPALGSNPVQPLVWGDLVLGNGERELTGRGIADRQRAAGVRLTTSGAERLWRHDAVHVPSGRFGAVAHAGIAYLDSNRTGFHALDMATGAVVGHLPHLHHLTGGSHNWTWHLASNDRILTSGGLQIVRTAKGLEVLPGRLALPLASGYICPVKPAMADGRLVLRTDDGLVCYDLRRRDTDAAEVLVLTAHDAGAGMTAGDVHLRVRLRAARVHDLAAAWPRILDEDRVGLPDWLGESRHQAWRASRPAELAWDGTRLHGPAPVRIGYQQEAWELDVQRAGDVFVGTYVRRAEPLPQPVTVTGGLSGQRFVRPDGSSVWAMYLPSAIGAPPALAADSADQGLSLAVHLGPDGTITRALAWAGKVNTQPWECDIGSLALSDGRLHGTVTVITRDDQYHDLHFVRAQAQRRIAADGGALAATYRITATAGADRAISGEQSGTIGVTWERRGRVSGTLIQE